MVQISADLGNGAEREGGEVPDGLHSGVQLTDITERGRPGPEVQLRPLHGHGVPLQRLPEGALMIPWL